MVEMTGVLLLFVFWTSVVPCGVGVISLFGSERRDNSRVGVKGGSYRGLYRGTVSSTGW